MAQKRHPATIVVLSAVIVAAMFALGWWISSGRQRPELVPTLPEDPASALSPNAAEFVDATRLARFARGRILDVSQDPAFAGLAATNVTIDFNTAVAADAARSLYRALDIPEPTSGRAGGFLRLPAPMTMHLHDVPLLDAVLQFCAQSNSRIGVLTPQTLEFSSITDNPLNSSLGPDKNSAVGVWCAAGPFAVSLDNIDTSAVFSAAGNVTRTAMITITAYAEPALNVIAYPHELHVSAFVDEFDHALNILPPPPPIPVIDANRTPSTTRYALQLPAPHGHRIAMLRGTAPFTLLADSVTLETALPLTQSHVHYAGGMKVEFLAPDTPAAASSLLRVRFSRGDMPVARWQVLAPLLADTPVQAFGGDAPAAPPFVDVASAARGRAGGRPSAAPAPAGDFVELNLIFLHRDRAMPVATRAVFSIPAAVRQVDVPFEFKDIVLP
jgi:hypothetical protein